MATEILGPRSNPFPQWSAVRVTTPPPDWPRSCCWEWQGGQGFVKEETPMLCEIGPDLLAYGLEVSLKGPNGMHVILIPIGMLTGDPLPLSDLTAPLNAADAMDRSVRSRTLENLRPLFQGGRRFGYGPT